MIDFPLSPTPGVTTVTVGRKKWLCSALDGDGNGVWDLVSTPDEAAAQALEASVSAVEAQAAAEAAAALAVTKAAEAQIAVDSVSGVVTSRTYDVLGRLISFIQNGNTYTVAYYTAGNGNGQVSTITGGGITRTFSYDASGFLTDESCSPDSAAAITGRTYDAQGRLTGYTQNGLPYVVSYYGSGNGLGQVSTIVGGGVTRTFTYNANGYLTDEVLS